MTTLREICYYASAVMAAIFFLWLLVAVYRMGQANAVANYYSARWSPHLKHSPLTYKLTAGLFSVVFGVSIYMVHVL